MTNEQLKHAKWVKEEIKRVTDLRKDMHNGEVVHIVIHMQPVHGHVEKPLHMLPDSITHKIVDALGIYTRELEKEFEDL